MTPVIIETNVGNISLDLDEVHAPITVANFLKYVDEGFYNGLIFHRVIADFMIQGGGFNTSMEQPKTHNPIKNEAKNGLSNLRGTIAMARTSVVDSATAQFFINLKDNDFLNHGTRDFGYAVFGKVTAGMDVVDKIGVTETHRDRKTGMSDVPVQPIVINTIRRA
ncbi:MAG: peptidyl-prolyl cis-trans isomerase [Planctomycetes bacterium]|jgi:peptidyl-prolyl cis-trans isomerase A (cyclophilin A)|nr:peptidyl-prolyl cis-trans isomerase [Planctomycetota bacterium]HPY74174.1 peptidylprolyl isomerase [Planctomycetota bacterium]HQA99787.1 peptidylprolyl isomerase [Planctomycetota bacterium]HRU52343.1 peptidylprolyl isomerase [Planctomycetota bacterium]